jgi:hypothetical protein
MCPTKVWQNVTTTGGSVAAATSTPATRSFQAVDFAPAKFFSFSREAKFGQFRPTLLLQVVC